MTILKVCFRLDFNFKVFVNFGLWPKDYFNYYFELTSFFKGSYFIKEYLIINPNFTNSSFFNLCVNYQE